VTFNYRQYCHFILGKEKYIAIENFLANIYFDK